MSKSYVIIAYRWGERCNHSYTVGCMTNLEKAISVAESHATYRGGKYECTVEECETDVFDNESDIYSKEVYRTDTWDKPKEKEQ